MVNKMINYAANDYIVLYRLNGDISYCRPNALDVLIRTERVVIDNVIGVFKYGDVPQIARQLCRTLDFN